MLNGISNFDQRQVYITDGNEVYRLKLNIANLTDGKKVAYVKRYIERADNVTAEKIKKEETAGKTRLNQPSDNSIRNPEQVVNKKFSMRDNVEETKDLIAVHNLSEEKLLKTVADRYQSKIDAINAKHDAAMQEMQDAHKAEIADLNRQWDEEAAAMEKSHKYDLEEQERLHKEHLRQVREKMNHDAEIGRAHV